MYQHILINDLNTKFYKLTSTLNDSFKGTPLYNWQTEYAYLINDILTKPEYLTIKIVDQVEKMFEEIAAADHAAINELTKKMRFD